MPDRRKHRGPHPQDAQDFGADAIAAIRAAVEQYSWLLTRGFAVVSALKLVGDRHALTARQRLAVMRSACSDQSLQGRRASRVYPGAIRGQSLAVDGYNLLITIESALAGGVVLIGRDGTYRDLASIHGTYRKVDETIPALQLVFQTIAQLGPAHVDWYLDRPVSNSGRLKALMEDLLQSVAACPWKIELAESPDRLLAACSGVVASSDSAVIDQAGRWFGLAEQVITEHAPLAWLIDLRDPSGK